MVEDALQMHSWLDKQTSDGECAWSMCTIERYDEEKENKHAYLRCCIGRCVGGVGRGGSGTGKIDAVMSRTAHASAAAHCRAGAASMGGCANQFMAVSAKYQQQQCL